MAIDVWFPLAVYYADLEDSAEHKAELVAAVHRLKEQATEKRTAEQSAWTGDVHRVEKLQQVPAFSWITAEVERHTLEYLLILGHDLDKIALYFQRSWPVVSQKGQRVSRHIHYTADVSAVYYVSVPAGGDAGSLRFYNEARPNELSPGIASTMTNGYSEENQFNYQQAYYEPVEGRLVIFPAKQSHSVDPNDTDGERISLSFDIVLSSRAGGDTGLHEFLMPPPSQWKRFRRRDELDAGEE